MAVGINGNRKGIGMLVSAAIIMMALIMLSPTGFGQTQGRPPVAPEHQEMVAKRAKERERVDGCQKQATEERILPRDRPQFVLNCLNGAVGPSQRSVVAPEYQELAAKRAKEKERVDNCQKQATEQKVLPRDRPQFVISCLEK
jgi:hypothetical protein